MKRYVVMGIGAEDFFYAFLSVIGTVILVTLVKVFGNLPTSMLALGTDLNLLTYGFLWDTSIKALRGQEFWSRFPQEDLSFLNKPTILVCIFIVNFLLMAFNLKLEYIVIERENSKHGKSWVTNWVLKPGVLAVGLISLFAFLFLNAAWS